MIRRYLNRLITIQLLAIAASLSRESKRQEADGNLPLAALLDSLGVVLAEADAENLECGEASAGPNIVRFVPREFSK